MPNTCFQEFLFEKKKFVRKRLCVDVPMYQAPYSDFEFIVSKHASLDFWCDQL